MCTNRQMADIYFKQNNQKAQTMLEYVIILGIVTLVLFAMNPMIKQGLQSMVKTVADQIGNQNEADQDFESGIFLVSSNISSYSLTDKVTLDRAGIVTYFYPEDNTTTQSESFTNLGFTNKD